MNNREVISKVSGISEVNENECRRVLYALEEVVSINIANSYGMTNLFNLVYNCMSRINNYKTAKK